MAKTHHFGIRLSLGVKIRSPFSTSHRQGCQTIFKNLLKSQKLKYAKVHTWVKAQPSFIRTNCRVHLNTVTTVYLNFFIVIYPRDAKRDYTFRFDHSQQNVLAIIDIILINIRNYMFSNLSNRLHEFWLILIFSIDFF